MRVTVLTTLLPAVHGLSTPDQSWFGKPKDGQVVSRIVDFLETYQSLLLPTTCNEPSIHTVPPSFGANATSTSSNNQATSLATTTQPCHSSVTSNSGLGTRNTVTPIWTPGIRFGSGLPGPAPASTVVASTGLLATSLGSAWQWPVLSSSVVTTAESITSNLIASASPSEVSPKPGSVSRWSSTTQDVLTQPSVSTLLSNEASLHPTLTTTLTCSSTAVGTPSSVASLTPGSTPPSSTSTSKKLLNTSFYKSLFDLPSQSSSQVKSSIMPSISTPSTKSTPAIIVVPITTARSPSTWTASCVKPVTPPNLIIPATSQPQANEASDGIFSTCGREAVDTEDLLSCSLTSELMPTSTMHFFTLKTSLPPSETSMYDTDPAVITSVMTPDSRCPYPYPGTYCGETKTTLITKTTKLKDKPKTSDPGCPYPGHGILC